MCGHNLINVRLCHCFFLCSAATCRDNLVARLNFVFASWHRPDKKQVCLFSTIFLAKKRYRYSKK